jgi:hypothetical protein
MTEGSGVGHSEGRTHVLPYKTGWRFNCKGGLGVIVYLALGIFYSVVLALGFGKVAFFLGS